MSYIDVNGKTGLRMLKGASGKTYGNCALLDKAELAADGIMPWVRPTPTRHVLTLDELKAKRKKTINSERDRWLDSDQAEVTIDGVAYEADSRSRTNLNDILTSISAGVPVPDPFTFRAKDNTNQSLTHAKLVELAGLMVGFKETAYVTSWSLKAAVDACVDEDDLNATEVIQLSTVDENGNPVGTIDVDRQVIRWPWPEEPIVVAGDV